MATNNKKANDSTRIKKKTSIGNSERTKTHNKGGGKNGSTISKNYKKKYRGQGRSQLLVRAKSMQEERPFLTIPLPSPEDQQRYEEWVELQEKKKPESIDEETHVVILDI